MVNNLIINAVQAMPDGGVILLALSNEEIRANTIFPLEPVEYVKILLRDHGIGIPKELLKNIFDPYFTTK